MATNGFHLLDMDTVTFDDHDHGIESNSDFKIDNDNIPSDS